MANVIGPDIKLQFARHGEMPSRSQQKVKVCMEQAWQVTKRPDPEDFDHESCIEMIDSAKAIPVGTPDECMKIPQQNFQGKIGKIETRFFLYRNEAPETGAELKDAIPTLPIMCYVETESDVGKCGGEDFLRTDFKQHVSENEKDFEDFLYWIDENEVQSDC